MAAPVLKSLEPDKDLVADACDAVKYVFQETFDIDLEFISGRVCQGYAAHGDISGMVGMVQSQLEGNLVVSFPIKTVFQLLSSVYGRKIDSDCMSVRQGVAEITNIVYGQVKSRLNARGYSFKMAFPHVVIGNRHEVAQVNESTSVVLNFNFSGYTFEVSLCLQV